MTVERPQDTTVTETEPEVTVPLSGTIAVTSKVAIKETEETTVIEPVDEPDTEGTEG